MQEVSQEREIEIPQPVRSAYQQWRPTPLYRAHRLEKALDTPAKIYYKYEGVSPSGSHKPNTAVPQAFFNKNEGIKRIATETGAGQWGSSLAYAAALFDLEVKVFMVKVSFGQKPYRKAMMETYGATCVASPSEETNAGRAILEKTPDSTGSLGIAISEAVEVAATNDDTKYALGSVFAGIALPFLGAKLRGGQDIRLVAVEPAACPSLTRGKYAYDFGDTGQMTPLVKMHTLGAGFVPSGFHAGGLVLKLVFFLVEQKVSFRHPKLLMLSEVQYLKRCVVKRKVRAKQFCLTFVATVTLICRPIQIILRVS